MAPVRSEPLEGNYFVSTYPPFSCWDAAGAERFAAALDVRSSARQEPPPLGLYVHVPFCVERCLYCYYLSHAGAGSWIDDYLAALAREAELLARRPALAGRSPDFVYFGGGTPSLLSVVRVRRLFEALRRTLWLEPSALEVTFECAPRSVNAEKLAVLRELGVTRLSMGVQQLDDEVLSRNGRVHRVADVERAWERIATAGFDVVNLDLIAGLLGETEASFEATLDTVLAWRPQSVTIYLLEMPRNTPLYRAYRAGRVEGELPTWPVKRARAARAFERLAEAGYVRRSAYAAVRDPIRHRFLYQDLQYHGADLLGLGVASFSHFQGCAQQNLASLDAYLEAVAAGRLPLWRGRELSAEERLVRELVLQLKLGRVDLAALSSRHGMDAQARFAEPLAVLEREGWACIADGVVEVTPGGLLRIDRELERFYLPEHRGVRYS